MDEQLERFKEYMVQQQAQSAEKIRQLEDLLVRFAQATRDRFAENERRFAENERRAQELDDKFAALLDAQIRGEDLAKERSAELDRKIAALVDAQMRTEETVKRMGERIDNLTR